MPERVYQFVHILEKDSEYDSNVVEATTVMMAMVSAYSRDEAIDKLTTKFELYPLQLEIYNSFQNIRGEYIRKCDEPAEQLRKDLSDIQDKYTKDRESLMEDYWEKTMGEREQIDIQLQNQQRIYENDCHNKCQKISSASDKTATAMKAFDNANPAPATPMSITTDYGKFMHDPHTTIGIGNLFVTSTQTFHKLLTQCHCEILPMIGGECCFIRFTQNHQ